jgi:hypothetical protein
MNIGDEGAGHRPLQPRSRQPAEGPQRMTLRRPVGRGGGRSGPGSVQPGLEKGVPGKKLLRRPEQEGHRAPGPHHPGHLSHQSYRLTGDESHAVDAPHPIEGVGLERKLFDVSPTKRDPVPCPPPTGRFHSHRQELRGRVEADHSSPGCCGPHQEAEVTPDPTPRIQSEAPFGKPQSGYRRCDGGSSQPIGRAEEPYRGAWFIHDSGRFGTGNVITRW